MSTSDTKKVLELVRRCLGVEEQSCLSCLASSRRQMDRHMSVLEVKSEWKVLICWLVLSLP